MHAIILIYIQLFIRLYDSHLCCITSLIRLISIEIYVDFNVDPSICRSNGWSHVQQPRQLLHAHNACHHTITLQINSTYSADASVLVQMSTESAQTRDKMHALLQSQTPADTM